MIWCTRCKFPPRRSQSTQQCSSVPTKLFTMATKHLGLVLNKWCLVCADAKVWLNSARLHFDFWVSCNPKDLVATLHLESFIGSHTREVQEGITCIHVVKYTFEKKDDLDVATFSLDAASEDSTRVTFIWWSAPIVRRYVRAKCPRRRPHWHWRRPHGHFFLLLKKGKFRISFLDKVGQKIYLSHCIRSYARRLFLSLRACLMC